MIGSPTAPAIFLLQPTTASDSYGEGMVTDWSAPTRTRLKRAEVQEVRSDERPEPGTPDRRVDERRLFVPYAVEIDDGDRIEVDGEPWRVEGRPFVKRGLGPVSVYTTATLRRMTGG